MSKKKKTETIPEEVAPENSKYPSLECSFGPENGWNNAEVISPEIGKEVGVVCLNFLSAKFKGVDQGWDVVRNDGDAQVYAWKELVSPPEAPEYEKLFETY